MSEPSLIVVGGGHRIGRKTIYGEPVNRKLEIRLTTAQRIDLQDVARSEGRPLAMVVRDAIDSYVGDFREKHVFSQGKSYQPE